MSRKLILLNFLFAFLPFVIICVILAHYFSLTILKERETSNRFVADSIANSLASVFYSINEVSLSMIADQDIREFLIRDVSANDPQYLGLYSSALSTMTLLILKEPSIKDIYIETMSNRSVSIGVHQYLQLTAREYDLMQKYNSGTWCWNYENGRLSMCRVIRNIYDINNQIGYLKIVIDTDAFFDLLNTAIIPQDMYFALYDGFGNRLLANVPEENEWLAASVDGDATLIKANAGKRVSVAGENGIFHLYPEVVVRDRTYLIEFSADHTGLYNRIVILIICSGAALFLLMVYVQTLLHRRLLLRPIEKLGSLMERIDSNDFSAQFDAKVSGEVKLLADKFNSMAKRLQLLYNQVYLDELRLKESEIKNLQMEINPHFIYNTLDSICWMINTGRTQEAERMVRLMSGLFRLSLYRTPDGLVPLEKEIEHARCFIDLQLLRFSHKISFTIDVQQGLADVYVVKLVLQPLLENAINHGIVPASGSGMISLAIYSQDNDLIYHVYDDGVGFDREEIEMLLKTGKSRNGTEKIALFNIDQRIKLKFGNRYGVFFHSPSQGGSVFVIRQPIVRRRSEQDV